MSEETKRKRKFDKDDVFPKGVKRVLGKIISNLINSFVFFT